MKNSLQHNEIVNKVIYSFSNFNLRDIIEINKCELDFTIAEFILCSCFIDQLSGFIYNTDGVKKRYIKFVNEYLPAYQSEELYEDLRNKLVHNYSVGKFYGLTKGQKDLHLNKQNGILIINLENFIDDLNSAFEQFISSVQKDKNIRKNVIEWYLKHNIISMSRTTA
jgi:hypothetical protein